MRTKFLALVASVAFAASQLSSSSFAAAPLPPPPTTGSPTLTANASATPASALGPGVPAPLTTAPLPDDYVIGTQDQLIIDVFQVPDLSKTVQVDASGNILMPLIGQVQASGRTAKQLSDQIAAALGKDYLKDPLVTVTVKESSTQKITVDGAVVQPGVFPIAGKTTLLQAIAMARGPDPTVADLHKVALFRSKGDQRQTQVYDLADIREGKKPDPEVYPNDIIIVDTSSGRSFLKDLGTFSGPLAPFVYLFGAL
jgi:polysaccharide export outer membrane protein